MFRVPSYRPSPQPSHPTTPPFLPVLGECPSDHPQQVVRTSSERSSDRESGPAGAFGARRSRSVHIGRARPAFEEQTTHKRSVHDRCPPPVETVRDSCRPKPTAIPAGHPIGRAAPPGRCRNPPELPRQTKHDVIRLNVAVDDAHLVRMAECAEQITGQLAGRQGSIRRSAPVIV